MLKFIIFLLIHIYFIYDLHLIGNILFRPDSNNIMIFSPLSILKMMYAPLIENQFWTTNLICSNYFFLLIMSQIIYLIIKKQNYFKCAIKLSS